MTGAFASEPGSREPSPPVSAPPGFDPSRDALGISQTVCFFPEEDDPENFDGSMMAWTFAVPKDLRSGPGIYELRFVRILTPEERGNQAAQTATLYAIATEARRAETLGSVHEGAVAQPIAQTPSSASPTTLPVGGSTPAAVIEADRGDRNDR